MFQKGHKGHWLGKKRKSSHGIFLKGHSVPEKWKEAIRKGVKKISGKNSRFWKGGKTIDKNKYICIYSPKHPNCNSRKYVFEHRLIAEKYLKRYLTKLEVIHHINEITNDNRPENLYLFPNQESHMAYHLLLRNKLIQPITKSNLFLLS